MSDIRSFFGGKGAAAKKAESPEAKPEAKPADARAPTDGAAARKRPRRVVDDDDDGDARGAPAPPPPPSCAPAAADADAAAPVAPASPAALAPTPPRPSAPADVAAPAPSGGPAADGDGAPADGGASDGAEHTPSPLLTKLRQAEGKAKSKGVLENMRLILDTARAFSVERSASGWKAGAPVPYAFLCAAFDRCAQTTKRLEITTIMTDTLRAILETTPADLLPTLYLSLNALGPAFAGIELGLGDALLLKAVAETCGRQEKQLKAELDAEGDLGSLAMAARATQRLMFTPAKLSVRRVFCAFIEIAQLGGKDCQQKKRDKVKALLVAAVDNEAMYLVRSLQGKLRVGLAEQTVLTALAHALALSPPAATGCAPPSLGKLGAEGLHEVLARAETVLKDVYSQLPSYDVIVAEALVHPLAELSTRLHLTAGVPVRPMLAKPTKGIGEVLERFGSGAFTCEYKYDGERAQLHRLPDGTYKIFSRNSEDMTGKYPDVLQRLPRALLDSTSSFIIDCEAVAYDVATAKLLPFQTLSTRAKKNVSTEQVKVQVKIFAFDCLLLNGAPLIKQPLSHRRAALRSAFREVPGEFAFASASDSDNAEEIADFLNDAVAASCEGLMVKTLDVDATYEPSKRSLNWLKVKKDYLEGMGDSLDLVPIGAYHGRGKRTGVYGAYLLACYDEEREEFQSICKIGTGFSEELLAQLAAFFREEGRTLAKPRPYYRFPAKPDLVPDVWLETCTVWEVLAADLSISPQHCAAVGEVDPSRGIALRFPRYIRTRDDKKPEQATSATQVAQMYRDQWGNAKKGKAAVADDDDAQSDDLDDDA